MRLRLIESGNDKRARFDAQVLPHLDAALRFARCLTRSLADAEDIVQDAIIRAYRGFDGLRGTDAKGWLFAIVRNCYLSSTAQGRRHTHVALPQTHDAQDGGAMVATGPGPEAAAIDADQTRVLTRLLAELPDEHREVLVLRELEDMNYRQIAMVTNVPIGTVMSRLARARAALRSAWQSCVEGELDAVR